MRKGLAGKIQTQKLNESDLNKAIYFINFAVAWGLGLELSFFSLVLYESYLYSNNT